jgi:hypothetical protein
MSDTCPTCGGTVDRPGSMPCGEGDARIIGKPCNNYAFHSRAVAETTEGLYEQLFEAEAERDTSRSAHNLALNRIEHLEAALSTAREALSRIRSESFDRYVAPAEYARAVQQIADGALAHLEGGHGE